MPSFNTGQLQIHYEQWGARVNPPLLLIHGLSCQLIHWPQAFIDELTDAGFRVIAADNRDIGLSDTLDTYPVATVGEILADPAAHPPVYTLDEMAEDLVALLNHLGQAGAHIVGLSMGGMIAQVLAIRHPERCFSLTSIMSTTGNPDLPSGDPEAMAAFFATLPEDREAAIAQNQKAWTMVGGPHYDSMACGFARRSAEAIDRGFSRAGFARQLLAVLHQSDRRAELGRLAIPALAIHGTADPAMPLAAGRDTANAFPNGRLVEILNMGHDLPDPLLSEVASAVIEHAKMVPATR